MDACGDALTPWRDVRARRQSVFLTEKQSHYEAICEWPIVLLMSRFSLWFVNDSSFSSHAISIKKGVGPLNRLLVLVSWNPVNTRSTNPRQFRPMYGFRHSDLCNGSVKTVSTESNLVSNAHSSSSLVQLIMDTSLIMLLF